MNDQDRKTDWVEAVVSHLGEFDGLDSAPQHREFAENCWEVAGDSDPADVVQNVLIHRYLATARNKKSSASS